MITNQTDSFIISVTAVKAAYTCKLLRLLPVKHTVRLIMELVGNRSSTLTTGNDKRSSLRRLKNSVPQGFLAPLVFNWTSTSLIYQPLSPESMHTPTIWQSCMLMETDKQWKKCSAKTWQTYVNTSIPYLEVKTQYYKSSAGSRTVARKSSIGVFTFVLDILKLTKTPLMYSVSYFNLGGLEYCLGGLSPLSRQTSWQSSTSSSTKRKLNVG